jgi:hypothetical protein
MPSDCFKFGSVSGCREDCPVLQRRECTIYEDADDFLSKTEAPQNIKEAGDTCR